MSSTTKVRSSYFGGSLLRGSSTGIFNVLRSTSKDALALSSANDFEDEIQLDEVLQNSLHEPFTKENFRAFLLSEYAEENLEFYENVENYRRSVNRSEALTLQVQIQKHFIDEEAPKQVNISSDLRNKVLDKLASSEKSETSEAEVDVFDEVVNEIKVLLHSGPFKRFITVAKTHNLSLKHANWRAMFGVFLFLLGLLLCAAMIALQVATDIEAFDSQFVRLLAFPTILMGVSNYYSGKYCLCPFLASKGKFMRIARDRSSWSALYCNRCFALPKQEKMKEHEIQDPKVKKLQRKLAFRMMVRSFLISAAVMTVITLLPPGEIYDALGVKI